MKLDWTNQLKAAHGYLDSQDISIRDQDCLKQPCFRAHDINHDGHLLCWSREIGGCPHNDEKQKSEGTL